jgi:hypothetical protein
VAKSDVPNNEIGYNKEIVPFCSNNTSMGVGKAKLEQRCEETHTQIERQKKQVWRNEDDR